MNCKTTKKPLPISLQIRDYKSELQYLTLYNPYKV